MNKLTLFAATGLLVAGLTLGTPAESKAQGFSLQFSNSRGGFAAGFGRYGGGFGYYSNPGYGYGRYDYGRSFYGGHGGFYGGHGGFYGGGHHGRRAIVEPEYFHWTPGRGIHSHGNVIVPHRGHFHVYPY